MQLLGRLKGEKKIISKCIKREVVFDFENWVKLSQHSIEPLGSNCI
jgi:hypothetical protein